MGRGRSSTPSQPAPDAPGGAREDDASLVARAIKGSQPAFFELARRHERAVFNLIVRLVRDPALAEDLAQDAFLKAFSRLATFDPAYKFSNWILKIAHNTAIDALRVRRLQTVFLESDVRDDERADRASVPPPSAEVERAELAAALERALEHIRPEYRHAIVLRYQEELSYEEIAGVTGLPLGTVKTFLHRGRAEMARLLTEAGWAPAREETAETSRPPRP
jgi:RNA polymerase sigma-70 factor (ECF subfamily)